LAAPPTAAIEAFGARLPAAERYAAMLCGAGVERGLIGPREAERIWQRHVLNSVALAKWVPTGARVVDIGSGAGLPGIPLALARPDLELTLCEPMQRRVAFLEDVVADLRLPVSVLRARAEQLPRRSFDVAVARAVAPLERLVTLARPALVPTGCLLALKGRSVMSEVEAAGATLRSAGATVEVETPRVAGETTYVVRITWPHGATRRGSR